jgi:lipopolysaccharide/colanic/teichoic acid biosynthesis glycosyltransferase
MLNVLRGDMSLVGPRPERKYFVEKLKEKVPFYIQRHAVKPGITGWAQIRFRYGASIEDGLEKLKYDLYYIKNMSPLLDLSILFETTKSFLAGSR